MDLHVLRQRGGEGDRDALCAEPWVSCGEADGASEFPCAKPDGSCAADERKGDIQQNEEGAFDRFEGIEQQNENRFQRGNATMVGKRITLRRGVRALTIECGWPRTPRDGIMRGNGLACANIKHFGQPKLDDELLLTPSKAGSPQWLILRDDTRSNLTESQLRRHFSFLSQS